MSDFEKAFNQLSKVGLENHTELWGEPKTERAFFEAGQASKQAEIDGLKTQLNNMEQCYMGKKKRAELLESNIKNLVMQLSNNYEVAEGEYKKNADSYYSGKCDAFDLAEQLAGLVLRGKHE